jgi:hypothetical protein
LKEGTHVWIIAADAMASKKRGILRKKRFYPLPRDQRLGDLLNLPYEVPESDSDATPSIPDYRAVTHFETNFDF